MVLKILMNGHVHQKKLLFVAKKQLKLTTAHQRQIFARIYKWWQGPQPEPPPPTIKDKFLALPKVYIVGVAALAMFVFTYPGFFYVTHIEETPLTGRRRFMLFNPYQFELISHELYSMFITAHKKEILPHERSEYAMVQRVANKLIQSNADIPELARKKWSVTIVNEPNQNMFVLPSGEILIYEGMLRICSNDDEFAVVLGHVMAHAFMGHTAELTNRLFIWDKLWMMFLLSVWAILPQSPGPLVHFFAKKLKSYFLYVPYDDKLELEADRVALKMTARACYDVRELSAFWAKLEALQSMHAQESVDWLYVHPDHKNRSESLNLLIPQAIRIRTQANCPALGDHDPRQSVGHFRENYARGQKLSHDTKGTPATHHKPDDLSQPPSEHHYIDKRHETHYSYAGQHHQHHPDQHPHQHPDQHPHQHPEQHSQPNAQPQAERHSEQPPKQPPEQR